MTIAPLRSKILPLLCLVLFAASSLHVHGPLGLHDPQTTIAANSVAAAAGALDAPRLSKDDAHHEHDSRASFDLEVCLACRSNGDDDRLAVAHAAPPRIEILIAPRGRQPDEQLLPFAWGSSAAPRAPPAPRAIRG